MYHGPIRFSRICQVRFLVGKPTGPGFAGRIRPVRNRINPEGAQQTPLLPTWLAEDSKLSGESKSHFHQGAPLKVDERSPQHSLHPTVNHPDSYQSELPRVSRGLRG